jgi:predicted TPR repeat methyltransferase
VLDFSTTMRRAVDLHVHGQLGEAETIYRRIIAEIPEQFDAIHNLGVLLIQRGRNDEALDFLRRASAINPQSASAHLNIGNALRNLDRPQDALQGYDRALAINVNYAEAHNNRGVQLRRLGRFNEALESYDRAVALKPAYAEAHNNRATVLREDLKRNQEALAAAEQALRLTPKDPDAHLNRAHALAALKRTEEAVASYRSALACGGDTELLSYYLAALGVGTTPATSPPRYVESLFDQYAGRFDHSLAGLKYAIPERLFETVVALAHPDERSLDIVDLGCGTGLCGPLFRALARTLTGVDLSVGMLEKAAERKLYDHLAKADLVDFLDAHPASFDLAIATDVFIYIGALERSFAAVAKALRPKGRFAFSVEACNGDSFVIRSSRRFAHSIPYLETLAGRHGFHVDGIIPVAVRLEEGQDILGHVAVLTLE